MGRIGELGTLRREIDAIGLTPREVRAVIDQASGRTHREAGNGSRWASMKAAQRARRRARQVGKIIPSPRRTYIVASLASF